MAERPKGYGMTAELARKKDAKYDPKLLRQTCEWIDSKCLPDTPTMVGKITSQTDFQESLKDGVTLCHLANAIESGSVKKINTSKMAFKQMENIGHFLSAADNMGVAKGDMFQTVDLYEGQNIPQVINGIHALARKKSCQGELGPKEAVANKREFTEEQLKSGQGVIGLQMGSNKGATQSGTHFGRPRQVAGTEFKK